MRQAELASELTVAKMHEAKTERSYDQPVAAAYFRIVAVNRRERDPSNRVRRPGCDGANGLLLHVLTRLQHFVKEVYYLMMDMFLHCRSGQAVLAAWIGHQPE